MTPDQTPPAPPASGPASPTPSTVGTPGSPRQRSCLFTGCAVLAILAIVVATTVAITLWWMQRPIQPVVLAPPEKVILQEKLERMAGSGAKPADPLAAGDAAAAPTVTDDTGALPAEPDRPYTSGDRTLRITERELNGLLNDNTELGQTVRLELGRDAVNAYMAVPIPEDSPIGAGKTFRARCRFKVSVGGNGEPFAILEDVSVLGLSLPKAWLGGLKGENLWDQTMEGKNGGPVLQGIKSLRIEPGQLVLEVEE